MTPPPDASVHPGGRAYVGSFNTSRPATAHAVVGLGRGPLRPGGGVDGNRKHDASRRGGVDAPMDDISQPCVRVRVSYNSRVSHNHSREVVS